MPNFQYLIEAARPKTLVVAIVPVLIGAGFAFVHGSFLLLPSLVVLFCALMIQIGTNLANDYFDHLKGADTTERIGFRRLTSSGLVSQKMMKWAMFGSFLIAFVAGLFLVWHAGWFILAIGLASIFFGYAYTGGPFPLAYNGLGDLFVLIFFGIIAVNGTYFVNVLAWNTEVLPVSVAVGTLAVAILVVNNLRDSETDKKAKKNTLGVLFGDRFLKYEFGIMLLIPFLCVLFYYFCTGFSPFILLPMLNLLPAILLFREVWQNSDKMLLNQTLEKTAQLMVLFGLMLFIGIILQNYA